MSIQPNLNKMRDRLADRHWVRAAVSDARRRAKPACAAFLSLLLRECRLLRDDEFFTWTSQLVGSETETSLLELRYPVVRILHPADVLPGDIIASRDRNKNNAPDHVFTVVSLPEGSDLNNPFALVVDNYCKSGKPYWRNLGRSGWHKSKWRGKTPMAYGLRITPLVAASSPETAHARQALVDMLPAVYTVAQGGMLSQATMHHLNQLRHSPELGDLNPRK